MSQRESLLVIIVTVAFSDSGAGDSHSKLSTRSTSLLSCWASNGSARCGSSENWPAAQQAAGENESCSCSCSCEATGNCCPDYYQICAEYAEQCTSANSFVDDQAVFERLDISVGAVITSEDIPQAPGNAPPPPQSSYDEETEDNVCSVDEDKLCNTESSFFGEREYFECKCSPDHCCQSGSMCKKNDDQEVTCTHPTSIFLLLLVVPFSLMIGCVLICLVMRYRVRRNNWRIAFLRRGSPSHTGLQLGVTAFGVPDHRRDQESGDSISFARTNSEVKNSKILCMADGTYTIAWPCGESGKSKSGARVRT